jgi:hypothetical protein
LADLLANLGYTLIFVILALLAIYLVLRVGTLAVLKSIDDFHRGRKQALTQGE